MNLQNYLALKYFYIENIWFAVIIIFLKFEILIQIFYNVLELLIYFCLLLSSSGGCHILMSTKMSKLVGYDSGDESANETGAFPKPNEVVQHCEYYC